MALSHAVDALHGRRARPRVEPASVVLDGQEEAGSANFRRFVHDPR